MKNASSAELTLEPSPPPQQTGMELARPQSENERMFSMIERMATDPQVEPAKLREILSVKQTWEADEARKAFAIDMAIFQSRCPIITKGDKAYDKMYARIDRIHRETRALRQECGFWFIWSKCDIKEGVAHMEGILGHRRGHTIPLTQIIPLPEATKGMNATQRAGSAQTYAKRYGECLALDIVTGEDDDGNGGKRPDKTVDNDAEVREAVSAIWKLLAPVRGTDKTWNSANQWLWKEELLDGGADEAMPKLSMPKLQDLIKTLQQHPDLKQ